MFIDCESTELWGVVLYADIRGFTRMTEKIGSKNALIQVGHFYDIVDKSIGKFGGLISNKMGDGILSFFALGKSIEPSGKEAAILAALRIQKEIASSSEMICSVGIGISSGEIAYVNNVFVGKPINLAARLSSVSSGGQIYVCEETIPLPSSEKNYEVSDTIPITLKGLVGEKLVFSITSRSCFSDITFEATQEIKSYG